MPEWPRISRKKWAMRADQLIQLITQLLFVLIFARVAFESWRRPRRVNIDITLLFGVLALLVAEGWVAETEGGTPPALVNDAVSALLMALPYLLYRLVQDFASPPRLLTRAAITGLVASTMGFRAATAPTGHRAPSVCPLFRARHIRGGGVRTRGPASSGVTHGHADGRGRHPGPGDLYRALGPAGRGAW